MDSPAGSADENRLIGLMESYQHGRADAFPQLHAALETRLRRYFLSITRDSALADDLVQETFMQVHKSRRTYRAPLPVLPWVFGVAQNVLRRHRRSLALRLRNDAAVAEVHAAGDKLPPPCLSQTEIDDALARLPRPRGLAWRLHHMHGLSFQEVGDRMRIGEGAAKLRSSRAMTMLRALLGISRGKRERGDEHD